VRKQVNEVFRPRKLVQIRRPSHTTLEQCGSGHGELDPAEVQLRAVREVLEQRYFCLARGDRWNEGRSVAPSLQIAVVELSDLRMVPEAMSDETIRSVSLARVTQDTPAPFAQSGHGYSFSSKVLGHKQNLIGNCPF